MVAQPQPFSKKVYWFLILVFVVFSITVGAAGCFFYGQQKKVLRKEKWDHISAIADMKVNQIVEWRKERLADAGVIQGSLITRHIADFLQNPEAENVKQELLEFMAILQGHHQHHSIVLLDGKGEARLAMPEHEGTLSPIARRLVQEALQKREVILSDLYRDELTHRIRLNLFVPITVKKGGQVLPVGLFLLRLDPYLHLFPIIRSWPVHSLSSECMLVRSEGDDALVLNDLIHRKDTALNLRLPKKETGLVSVMAVLGETGIVEGTDYRGAQVLAALRKVPDSPWFLAAKVDQEEIYAPIRMRAGLIATLAGLLIFGAGLSVALIWRGQRHQFEKGRYETELERRELSDRLDYLTRYAHDIILLLDEELNIVEVNDRAAEQYGYTREELLAFNARDLRTPEERPYLEAQFRKAKEQNGAIIETIHQRKDGTKFPMESSVRFVEVGEKKYYQTIIRDITERKLAEEALKKSEETARQWAQEKESMAEIGRIVSSTLNMEEVYPRFAEKAEMLIPFDRISIVAINHQSKTIAVNFVAGKELAGYEQGTVLPLAGSPDEELVRTRLSLFIQTEDEKGLSETMPCLLPAFKAGFRSMISAPLISKDQVIGGLHLHSIKPNAYTEGNLKLAERIASHIAGAIANAQLFAERQRAEKEKSLVEDQFRQSQKMEAIGKLAGGVAHDFNNLLTVIKGYCQISLLAIKEGDPLKEDIKEVVKAADRAADLTRQLLAFSRRQVMEMQVLDLNQILRNLDKMLRRMIGEDIELATLLSENLGRVMADPGQIEQVIMNLAVNAKDAMPGGGKLTLETVNVELDREYARNHVAVTPGRYVLLSVSDTGVGITPEVKERLFEPFFTTKEKGKGTGLGLSTVYGIVKQGSGNIWVYSEPGQGTTFKIYLPRVDEPAEELRAKIEYAELPRGSETILLVEDDEKVRKVTLKILEMQGYEVLEAGGGDEALEICRERKKPIHLVLTDVVMAGMNGRQMVEKLKEVFHGFKVLYMSGYTDNAIAQHGIIEKGLDFIQKPLSVEGLARKVREALDKT